MNVALGIYDVLLQHLLVDLEVRVSLLNLTFVEKIVAEELQNF